MVLYPTGSDADIKMYPTNMTTAMLHAAIKEAACDGRLVKGLSCCSKALQKDPDDLLMCVLPETTSNSSVTLGIQTILIESLCLEIGIPVVRVDVKQNDMPLRCHALEKEFTDVKSEWQDADSSPILQLDCLIIQKRIGGADASEKKFKSLLQIVEEENYSEFPE